MENVEIEVLTQAAYPLLRMPGRRSPGVVVQSDTLSTFVAEAQGLVTELRAGNRPLDDAQYLADELAAVLDHDGPRTHRNGIELPYVPEA